MLRVTVDTNVFVSSLLNKQGAPAQVLEFWRRREFLLVCSPEIIEEICQTLAYPHIMNKYLITHENIAQLKSLLEQEALIVPGIVKSSISLPEDPKDEIFLACALEGMADCIVSGDKHLLNLREFQGVPILSVQQFLQWIKAQNNQES